MDYKFPHSSFSISHQHLCAAVFVEIRKVSSKYMVLLDHSSGTTMQLSGARSTTELIARRAGLPLEPHYAKSERNSPLFPFYTFL